MLKIVLPYWIDEHGQRVPTRPCPKRGREAPAVQFRIEHLWLVGWYPYVVASYTNWCCSEVRPARTGREHGIAYAERQGWTVNPAHVFEDDGVSGALFGAGRPGLARLLNALTPRPPFQILVMSEESRLGREAIETGWTLKQILDAGVRVFFYLENRERTLDTAMDKVMLSLSSFASEMEREKARQRTHDAMIRKARAGHVTGGEVYGYRRVEVLAADGRRSHVERVIDPAQAAVIARIFTDYAAGHGLAEPVNKNETVGS